MSWQGFSFHLVELGHLAAYLALAVAFLQALAPLAARVFRQPSLAAVTVPATWLIFLLVSLGGVTLIQAFVTDNFSVKYVASHSNSALPLFYKVSALWGGHEGSLYLWLWVLTAYTLAVVRHGRRHYPERLPVLLAFQAALMIGFLGLILFLSNPFDRLFPVPPDGRDLNPLLQHPGMVFHPPMLYLGYVGFSVPFAFALTALVTKWKSELWVGYIRRWALIAWGFLTAGIVLGAWWAYTELGWGGYWAWDPVENASFMPWLIGTALIHSITVQERRRLLHTWNLFLVITAFSLSLLGTFLVRSGVLSSVHAFAVDPGRGAYILGFLTFVLAGSFAIFLARGRYQEAEENLASWLSRESFFVWNNVIFTVAMVCVLIGTLYPLALEALTGAKITVGAPYFNAVLVPILLALLVIMAIAPHVPWRKADLARLAARFRWSLSITVAAAIGGLFIPAASVLSTVTIAITAFLLASIGVDVARHVGVRRAQHAGENLLLAGWRTVAGNRRYFGGVIVHLGIVLVTMGLIGSGFFKQERVVLMNPGEVVIIAGEPLRFDGVEPVAGPNYLALRGHLTLLKSQEELLPERRRYPVQEMPTTESAIHIRPWRDLYVVLGEQQGERFAVQLHHFPLLQFLWGGTFVMLVGLGLALSTRQRRTKPQETGHA